MTFPSITVFDFPKKRLLSLVLKVGILASTGILPAFGQEKESLPKPAPTKEKESLPKRVIRFLLADSTAPGKPSFRLYPTLGYAPETSVEIGFSSMYLYQAKEDTLNRLSELTAFTFFTLNSQYGLWLDNALYGDKDQWFLLGRTRFQRFPLLYYGVGSETSGDNPAIVDATYLMARQRFLLRIAPNVFLGPQVDFQKLYNTNFQQPEAGTPFPEPTGAQGTTNLGLGAGIVYDNRHNVLNVRKGFFAELGFLTYQPAWKSDFSFQSFTIDTRMYRPVRTTNVLAWQVYANFLNGQVPFNMAAMLGGDMIMRGYYMGRYRDNHQISAQVEYRWLPFKFSKRFGGTVFAAAGAVSPEIRSFNKDQIRFSGGAGLRYFLFPKKDIFLRLDAGFTREGPGFYIITGEAF